MEELAHAMADLQGRKVFKVFNQDFIVDERYNVTKELGQGAYGIVWYVSTLGWCDGCHCSLIENNYRSACPYHGMRIRSVILTGRY